MQRNSDGLDRGGLSVQFDGSISLYGEFQRLFYLSEEIVVRKFTKLTFFCSELNSSKSVMVCIQVISNATNSNRDCSSRCFSPQSGQNDVNIGHLFSDRTTTMRSIEFRQKGKKSKSHFKSFRIIEERPRSLFDENGLCVDPHAQRSKRKGCMCLDGFASSNGGKIQGSFDTCLNCISQSECSTNLTLGPGNPFDKEVCALVRNVVTFLFQTAFHDSQLSEQTTISH